MKALPGKTREPEILPPGTPVPYVRTWNGDWKMRASGYTANPDICPHRVKGYTPRDGWWCKDCGEELKDLK